MKPSKVPSFNTGLLLLLMICAGSLAFAQTRTQAVVDDFGARGVVVTPQTRDGQTEYLVSGTPVPVTIVANPIISDRTIAFLMELSRVASEFEILHLESVLVNLRAQESTAILRLTDFVVDTVNLVPHLPEGLVFRYQDALYYDFSMIVENLRLRIRGQYFSEEELAAKLGRIYAKPSQYLLSQDSEYVVTYLQEIEAQNAEITAQLEALQNSLATAMDAIDAEEAARIALGQELIALRDGVILLNTRGFFGSFNDFDRNVVARLVEYRESNPNATKSDAENWLKGQGLSASGRLVQIALIVYFAQFE